MAFYASFLFVLAGLFIAISSITYAAISTYLSLDTAKDKQWASGADNSLAVVGVNTVSVSQ